MTNEAKQVQDLMETSLTLAEHAKELAKQHAAITAQIKKNTELLLKLSSRRRRL
jgi:hypothetical protein